MPKTRWLDTEAKEAWRALSAMLFTLPPALDSQLQRDEDLTLADYTVLAMLAESPGRCMRMSDLAAAAQTSQSRLSRIAARLETDGHLVRSMAPGDRRVVLAQLTEAGAAKVAHAAPRHVETVRRLVFDRLNDDQICALAEIGRALVDDSCPTPLDPGARRALATTVQLRVS